MRRAVVITAIAALMVAAGGCALLVNFNFGAMRGYEKDPPLSPYKGALKAPGLEGPVDVYRDDYGIPHVFTENEHDLFFATGYVQAQDRLWEMTLFRAIAEGRMAELFGDIGVPGMEMAGLPLSTVGIDKHQRIVGMKYLGEIGEELLRRNDPRIYAQCQAFCDGVNALIDSLDDWNDLPVEFQILRVRPEPLRVANILSFGRFIGTLLCSNMAIELPRHAAIKKYGPDKGWDLFPLYGAPGPSIVPVDILKNRLDVPRDLPPGGRPSDAELGIDPALSALAASRLVMAEYSYRQAFMIDPALGSNNWVVAGKLTESGNAMLANDPHLQHVEPSLFYIMHLKGAGYDSYGVTFPGNPYVALGHNKKFAWGATTSRADVQDLFIETVDPKRPGGYIYQGEWRPFTIRREVIRVRTGRVMTSRVIEVRQTVHGPVINDFAHALPEGTPPVALRWTGWDFSRDTRSFELAVSSSSADEYIRSYEAMPDKFEFLSITMALERLMRAEGVDDFVEAMDLLVVPNQNWVAADAAGRIAYLPGGLVPVRGKGMGALPVPGESGEFDWTGFIPLMEIPHAIDPGRGWMATANNQVVDPRWYPYVFSTHYAEPWRAMRIEEMIEELKPLDVEDMVRIQNDVLVKRAEWEVPIILRAVDNKRSADPRVQRAAAALAAWDYQADLDNTEAVIFFEFVKAMFDNVLSDEVDKSDLKAIRIEGYPDMVIDLWIARGSSPYFDDKRTKDVVEDMDDMIVRSLADAMAGVDKEWGKDEEDRRWGDIHVIKWFHLLGFSKGKSMSVGPYPHLGAAHTVRNAKEAGFGRVPYKAMTGACWKHIIDLGDPDRALGVIDGSQSGQWLSPHYDDMHKLFVEGEYVVADKDADRIRATAPYHLVLEP